jgi:lipopolysaccharide cholinephosphotransferase
VKSRQEDDVADHSLRALQLVELDILKEFVRLCAAHRLRYYVAYGTLLGAIRHRGFIPWDDDIDVTMPRRDYDRFAELCASGVDPGYRWQSYSTDDDYPNLFGKFLKNETVLRQAAVAHLPFEQSVCIDVFPLDGRADSWWGRVLQRTTIRASRIRLGVNRKRTAAKRAFAQLTRVLPRRFVIAAFEAMTRAQPAHRSATSICTGGPYGYARQSFPSHWFGEGAPQNFEGVTVMGPRDWHEYLTQLYGDYMTPPSNARRVSHHDVTELSLGAPPTADQADARRVSDIQTPTARIP